MFRWGALFLHLKGMRHYIAFAFVLFAAGIFVGGTEHSLSGFLQGQLQGMGEIANSLQQSDNPGLRMFLFIFLNNTIKSILVIYLGALFGIFPVIFLVVNGMVLGFLYSHLEASGANALAMFVQGVLPHGIIEIPIVVLAAAYGLRLGTMMFKGLFAMVSPKSRTVASQIESMFKHSLPLTGFITVMPLIAAVIESTFTVWLLEQKLF